MQNLLFNIYKNNNYLKFIKNGNCMLYYVKIFYYVQIILDNMINFYTKYTLQIKFLSVYIDFIRTYIFLVLSIVLYL